MSSEKVVCRREPHRDFFSQVFSWGLIPVGSVINENLLLAEENGPKEKGGGGSASGGGGGGEEVPGRDKAGSGLSLIGGAGIGQVGLASNNLDSHQLPGRSQGRSRYLREVVESSAVSYYTDGDVAFGDFKGAQAAKKKIESVSVIGNSAPSGRVETHIGFLIAAGTSHV